jgi:predicted Zn-dependent peptidase
MPKIVDLFHKVMTENIFPAHEIQDLKADRKQKLLINLEKVNFQAQRTFQRQLFGESAYSQLTEPSDYDKVSREDIVSFFEKAYLNGLFRMVLVGDFKEEVVKELFEKFKPWLRSSAEMPEVRLKTSNGECYTTKDDAMQTAIRVGRLLFTKNHPDFIPFSILNTILGDYFGSRLMKNIREDKGFTYGIGSHINELKNDAYFVIGSEVGKDVYSATIQEIKFEMERLHDELIPEEELLLVRNYLEGQLLKSADGPYSMTDLYLNVFQHGKSLEFYNDYLKILREITPENLRDLARKYLRWEEMIVVGVG